MEDSHKKFKILRIRCADTIFEFPLRESDDAWYCLDGRESVNGDEKLKLNADRDVYAIYIDKNGKSHYGTVGDGENTTIADNYPVSDKETYIFYENPKAEKYYV